MATDAQKQQMATEHEQVQQQVGKIVEHILRGLDGKEE